MIKRTIVINGDKFCDLESFYCEVDRVLTKNLEWQTGHNLDAFNDLLRGGFGVHEYEEPIKLIWENLSTSKNIMGLELIETLIAIIRDQAHIDFTSTN